MKVRLNHPRQTVGAPLSKYLYETLLAIQTVFSSKSSRLQLHPFVWDVVITGAASFAAFGAGLVTISLLGRLLGATSLGEYLLLKRVMMPLQTIVQLGLGVGLPRYIAYAVKARGGEAEAYFLATVKCFGTTLGVVGVLLNSKRHFFAQLFFGTSGLTRLIFPLTMMLVGLAAHVAVYGFYRGKLQMRRAGALQICDALIPLFVVLVLFRTGSITLIISSVGALMTGVAVVFGLPIFGQLLQRRIGNTVARTRELLRYGITRVPGDVGAGALFSLGPIIAAHFVPISSVTHLLLGTSVLSALGMSVTPLGLVLLSKTSMMLAGDHKDIVREHLGRLVAAVLELSTFACLQVVVLSDVILRLWLGRNFLEGVGVVRIVVLATPFLLFYLTLRSVIDASSVKALNAYNLLCSLVVFLAFSGLVVKVAAANSIVEGIAIAFVLGLITLGWLTARSVSGLYDVRVQWSKSVITMLAAVLLGGVSLLVHRVAGPDIGILEVALLESVVFAAYVSVLMKFGSGWLPFVWKASRVRPAMSQVG